MDVYVKNNQSLKYKIEYKAIKNTYFRIKDDYVCITSNKYISKKQILSYLDLRFERFHRLISKQEVFDSPHYIYLWGKKYSFSYSYGRFSYQISENEVISTSTKKDAKEVKKHIYAQEMIKKLPTLHPIVEKVIQKKGISILPIRLKYLKSKYGSYHRKHHEITLNTFLATLKEEVTLYVLFHEYAHVLVFNHSKDFYNLLGEFMPNHRIYQKDLKKIAII